MLIEMSFLGGDKNQIIEVDYLLSPRCLYVFHLQSGFIKIIHFSQMKWVNEEGKNYVQFIEGDTLYQMDEPELLNKMGELL
ncbi:hypothetical protein IEE86_18020 [Bacillus sp. 28A-2]|uniref:hypothetical protein n=1 Tax=Bacillus sp. 28A-2 TaxID=2772252 RepID=UPI00168D1C26|nr:hypothetical protein [Bacillus sp. 28A-2]MBD3861618.1 hypothetical protein [Bacillus sp. 28A-2]